MQLLEFYESLPSLEMVPQFYVKGYTEALKTYRGVRVIPDMSYIEGLPKTHKDYLKAAGFPCYFIPHIKNNYLYGYTVKSYGKRTPRKEVSGYNYLPGYEDVKEGSTIVFVEGIKDSYLPRTAKLLTLPMCTSSIPTNLLRELAAIHCRIIYCPDNDEHRNNSIVNLTKKLNTESFRIPMEVFYLQGIKDFGEFFDSPAQRAQALSEVKRLRQEYLNW